MRRSPPVLAMSTSRPAPPYPRSSYDGFVSGWSFSPPWVSRLSSSLIRSSPQPPYMRSRPVPPTNQSWPRSPNSASLPSVGTAVYLVWPWIHWVSSGPSVASKFSSQLLPLPVLDREPLALSRILRSGSLASYRANLVVVGL